ncbi:glycosyl transferase/glycoside hydrolase-like protein [Neobacillus bataviensis LMG 21833]|uniref:Glycosyl transferase/glycoside hydrolase-like protein n=1 Tax=Neobacillus bataviensis LMG 21833 TaxID=1117379 RepID=K6C553_9BACI|nr:glycosyltransferase family 4 protein [Neobacillus bataviensis]EKN66265.1 glycosyl transferase/glycoside hydrolase-like protein [Neobacillus bataviensis LMG 21833]
MNSRIPKKVDSDDKPQKNWQLTILMLCWEFPPNIVGGLSRHVFGLSTHLAMLGHEVHVLTARNNELPSFERMNGVNVHRVKPINEWDDHFLSWIAGLNLAMSFKAEQLSKEVKFNLIHAHDWLVGAASITLKEFMKVPLLTTIHATEHGRNNGIHTEMQQFIHEKEKQLILESDQLIVCSEYMKEGLVSIFNAKNEKISVIPNGIEPLNAERNVGDIFPELKRKKYIFSIGRIVQEKGFETIIEAAACAKEMNVNCLFVIAGKGPLLEAYQKQIIARKLDQYVIFIGYITDEQRNALIEGSAMAVIPSLYEPFGIVALETMILGKPTIVANTGGMKGIVKHLQTGMLMVPGDAKSLLKQIEFLLNDPVKAEEIGEKGRQIVKSLYGWKRIASETSRRMEDTIVSNRINENEQNATPNNL